MQLEEIIETLFKTQMSDIHQRSTDPYKEWVEFIDQQGIGVKATIKYNFGIFTPYMYDYQITNKKHWVLARLKFGV